MLSARTVDAKSHGELGFSSLLSVRQMLIRNDSRTMISCGKHTCPQRCHQLSDHSKVQCKQIMQDVCPKGHNFTWECWKQSVLCSKCEAEIRKREAKRQRDHKLDMQRQVNERVYAQRLAELDEEIAHERRMQREEADRLDRERVLQQRRNDLADAQAATRKKSVAKSPDSEVPASTENRTRKAVTPMEGKPTSPSDDLDRGGWQGDEQQEISRASAEWKYQKRFESADNEHLDALMEMIGLESVKERVLTIKTRIDTCYRQGVTVKDERFGTALLGNPGTGMTPGLYL